MSGPGFIVKDVPALTIPSAPSMEASQHFLSGASTTPLRDWAADDADSVVVSVRDVQVSGGVKSQAVRKVKPCLSGTRAIAGEAGHSSSGNRGDNSRLFIHPADSLVERVGNK